MTDDDLAYAADWLRRAERVCVLTGAGVSAESGVPTFRASDGLWEGHRIEDVASPEGFERDPQLVWKFYNARRANVTKVKPNPGHHALAKLEERWGDRFTLVTQNVDGLHRAAGSRERAGDPRQPAPHALPGLSRGRRPRAGAARRAPGVRNAARRLRPDIVWFGEALPEDVWEAAAIAALTSATCFLVVGTSAVVHPAASLVPIAKRGQPSGEGDRDEPDADRGQCPRRRRAVRPVGRGAAEAGGRWEPGVMTAAETTRRQSTGRDDAARKSQRRWRSAPQRQATAGARGRHRRRQPGQPHLRPEQAQGVPVTRSRVVGTHAFRRPRRNPNCSNSSQNSTPTPPCMVSWSSFRCRSRSTRTRSSGPVAPSKDVDCFHPENVGLLAAGHPRSTLVRRTAWSNCCAATASRRRAKKSSSSGGATSSASRWR